MEDLDLYFKELVKTHNDAIKVNDFETARIVYVDMKETMNNFFSKKRSELNALSLEIKLFELNEHFKK